MFDAHCHLDLEAFDDDLDATLSRARAAGVSGLLVAGIDPDGWLRQDRLARRAPEVALSYGVHPQVVAEVDDDQAEAMVHALAAALDGAGGLTRPVALGETGLDRSRRSQPSSLPRQERAFCQQLRLARQHELPVVLHILGAHGRALELLEAEGLPACGGLVHSFSGPAELVSRYVALGLYISMAGTLTWAGARKPLEAAAAVPLDRLLIETDAPDQTPAPHRGQRNEPAFLVHILKTLSELRGVPAAELAALTEDNARRLYGLPQQER